MIYLITKDEADKLLTGQKCNGKYLDLPEITGAGRYILPEDCGKWTAIDNSTGDAWTEEFDTFDEAIGWVESTSGPKEDYLESQSKSNLERLYDEEADRVREAIREERRKTQEENERANRATEALFRLIEFVNKDSWGLFLCKDYSRWYIKSNTANVQIQLAALAPDVVTLFNSEIEAAPVHPDASVRTVEQVAEYLVRAFARRAKP